MSNLVTEAILKKLKKASVVALSVILAGMTFTGCVGTSQLMADSGTDAPIVMKYTVTNPLNVEDVKEGSGAEFEYHYIKVSGLKDKEVEQKINDRIKAVYDSLRVQDIPPYRGIKARIPKGFILRNESIYVNVAGNFNNILSIMFDKYAAYQDPKSMDYEKDPQYYDSSRYYSEIETLNFDLSTGEEIKLRELFCDNVDYMELINDRMSRFLDSNFADDEGNYIGAYSVIKQVESFKGLAENQVFAVYPNGLAFVIDYRTPQFETGGIAVSPLLYYPEFGDNLALTQRFYSENENIYESEAPTVKSFAVKFIQKDITGNIYTEGNPISTYQSWSYSSELPEQIKNKMEKMRAVDRSKVEELEEICEKLPSGTGGDPTNRGAYEVMVYGEKIGSFYNICRNTNIYLPDTGSMTSEYHCYEEETLKELKLQDIFKKDVDYRSILGPAMKKSVRDTGYEQQQGGTELSEAYYTEAINQIHGFNLGTDSILIAVPDLAAHNRSGSMNLYIPYKDIGCNNLTIFDE